MLDTDFVNVSATYEAPYSFKPHGSIIYAPFCSPKDRKEKGS